MIFLLAILKELKLDSFPPPYIFIFISYKTEQQPPFQTSSNFGSPLVNSVTQFTNIDQYLLITSTFFFWFHEQHHVPHHQVSKPTYFFKPVYILSLFIEIYLQYLLFACIFKCFTTFSWIHLLYHDLYVRNYSTFGTNWFYLSYH